MNVTIKEKFLTEDAIISRLGSRALEGVKATSHDVRVILRNITISDYDGGALMLNEELEKSIKI